MVRRDINVRCADLLDEIVKVWCNPPKETKHYNRDLFVHYLRDHPDKEIHIEVVKSGYPLHLKNRDTKYLSKKVANIVNSKEELEALLKRVLKELKNGYNVKGSGFYQLNFLCADKKNPITGLFTDIRLARHGSYSTKWTVSINDNIDEDECKIPSLPHIREYLTKLIQYEYASLRDLKDAFPRMLLSKPDCGYLQYSVFGLEMIGLRQIYGISSAARNCQDFAELLIWICEKHYVPQQLHNRMKVHIDDYLILGHTIPECKTLTKGFDDMSDDLIIPISHEKDENWIQTGVVHGMGFNIGTPVKTVHIPKRKFWEIMNGIALFIMFRLATGEALDSMAGKMMHWSQLRKHAKIMCYRLQALIREKIRENPKLKTQIFYIPFDIVRDLLFWAKYMLYMHKIPMASVLYTPSITITAASDASKSGGGYVLGSKWTAYKFSEKPNKYGIIHSKMSINYQEAHAVIMMLWNHRKFLTGKKVLLYLDNKSVMYSMFRNWSNSDLLVEFIQEITLLQCIYCIDVHVDYIPSVLNDLSDALSRSQLYRFLFDIKLYGLEMDPLPSVVEYYPTLKLLRGETNFKIDPFNIMRQDKNYV